MNIFVSSDLLRVGKRLFAIKSCGEHYLVGWTRAKGI